MVLNKINNKNLAIFLYHLKLVQQDILKKEIEDLGILKNGGKILEDGDIIYIDELKVHSKIQDIEL